MNCTLLHVNSADAMENCGAALGAILGGQDLIYLRGRLGAGKTTFARGVISAYCGAREVPSPSFPIVQFYEQGARRLWHFDAYRLEDLDEIWEIGLEEALAEGVSLIEWPENLGDLLPAGGLDISIDWHDNGRTLRFGIPEKWAGRLDPFLAAPGIGVTIQPDNQVTTNL